MYEFPQAPTTKDVEKTMKRDWPGWELVGYADDVLINKAVAKYLKEQGAFNDVGPYFWIEGSKVKVDDQDFGVVKFDGTNFTITFYNANLCKGLSNEVSN